MLQALCNALNKDYRSFQARFALSIHGGVAESRFASCRRRGKACRRAIPRFTLPCSLPHFVTVRRDIVPTRPAPHSKCKHRLFGVLCVIQAKLHIVKAPALIETRLEIFVKSLPVKSMGP